jgi:hypothetical protein
VVRVRRRSPAGHRTRSGGCSTRRSDCAFPLAHVDAEIDTRNAASIGVIERLGFVRRRLVRNADNFKGTVSDEVRYVLMVPASRALR